jgi:hypothetical protein
MSRASVDAAAPIFTRLGHGKFLLAEFEVTGAVAQAEARADEHLSGADVSRIWIDTSGPVCASPAPPPPNCSLLLHVDDLALVLLLPRP